MLKKNKITAKKEEKIMLKCKNAAASSFDPVGFRASETNNSVNGAKDLSKLGEEGEEGE